MGSGSSRLKELLRDCSFAYQLEGEEYNFVFVGEPRDPRMAIIGKGGTDKMETTARALQDYLETQYGELPKPSARKIEEVVFNFKKDVPVFFVSIKTAEWSLAKQGAFVNDMREVARFRNHQWLSKGSKQQMVIAALQAATATQTPSP